MSPKTRFLKIYDQLSVRARRELILSPYGENPMSINVCAAEVRHDTKLGAEVLKALGFTEDEE